MNQSELDKIRHIHETKGLQLNTASGLSGTIYDADRSATGPVTALLDECSRSFDKDAEISRLSAQVKDLTEALRPFAEFGISIEDGETDVIDHDMLLRVTDCFAKPDFMRARSVIEAEIKEK